MNVHTKSNVGYVNLATLLFSDLNNASLASS